MLECSGCGRAVGGLWARAVGGLVRGGKGLGCVLVVGEGWGGLREGLGEGGKERNLD